MTRDPDRERTDALRNSIATWLLVLNEPALREVDRVVMREVAKAHDERAEIERALMKLESAAADLLHADWPSAHELDEGVR